MKILSIRNSCLKSLIKILQYDMPFAQGRMRNRFLELIAKAYDTVDKDRLELCNKLCVKDENDKPILKDGQFVFPPDTTVFEELNTLYAENTKIDFPPSMYTDIGGIKGLIELSTVVLTPNETADVELVLEAFSHIDSEPADLPVKEPEPENPEDDEDEPEQDEGGVKVKRGA